MDTANTNAQDMDSTEKKKLTLKRITGVLWFFLCVFGALAAIGFLSFQAQLSNWELYLQLGILGGAATMTLLGALQLGQAFMFGDESGLQRLKRASGFFLGIFGAALTLGGFFALLKYPNAQPFLRVGLIGGAATLAVTGLLTLGEVFAMETPGEETGGPGSSRAWGSS